MSAGNTPQKYVWEVAGNPTNISLSIINPPIGALVIDSATGNWYRKTTSYGDNSGFQSAGAGEALPIWLFEASSAEPNAGTFQSASGTKPSNTSAIRISFTTSAGSAISGYFDELPLEATTFIITNTATGKTTVLHPSAITNNGTSVTINCTFNSGDDSNWSGTYVIQPIGLGAIRKVNGKDGVGTSGEVTLSATDVGAYTIAQTDNAISAAIAAMLANSGSLAALLSSAGITPVVDGTVNPVTSITTKDGITTAAS